MKKILALLLTLTLALSLFAGCGKEPAKTPEESVGPVEPEIQRTPEEQILWDRRVTAENYLRELASILWRADETIRYTSGGSYTIVGGRLYSGLPYSYGGASLGAWLDHSAAVDENGVHTLEGLTQEMLKGNSTTARLGIDCSGTLSHAWQAAGANVRTESTNDMTPANGYLKVGEYEAPEDKYESTKSDCTNNGLEVMSKAYAQLQKADAVVTSNGSGHARFVVGVNVVYREDGSIDPGQSTVKTIEQNGRLGKGIYHYDETLKENVYECITVDEEYSFSELCFNGYLPVTNKIFVDPSPIEEPVVTDTVKEPTISNLFSGAIRCNWALDNVTVTITDASGAAVQSSILHPQRRTELSVSMSQFSKDAPENKTVGVVSPLELAAGSYHCKVTCRTVAGHVLTAREFDFTV